MKICIWGFSGFSFTKLVDFELLRPPYCICHFEFRKSDNRSSDQRYEKPLDTQFHENRLDLDFYVRHIGSAIFNFANQMQSLIKIGADEKFKPQRLNDHFSMYDRLICNFLFSKKFFKYYFLFLKYNIFCL